MPQVTADPPVVKLNMDTLHILRVVAVVGLCMAATAVGPCLLVWRAWNDVDRMRLRLEHRERQLAEKVFEAKKTQVITLPPGDWR